MRGGPVAVSRITKSENCAAAQRRGASESVPLLGMRDMAVAAATVFMAFEPGRLPIVLGFANWLKFHVPMVMGASAWMFVISPTPEGREMPAPLYGERQGQVEYAAAFRLEQAIRPDALETSDPPSALLWDRITRARVRGPVAQPDRATVS
jgi:hypothetical protein